MTEWVLVVDDDASNLRMASHILSSESMRVSCLKSGEDALSFLAGNRPDLVLLDIHMEGLNGFETMEKIQQDQSLSEIPVIFLTADEDAETETRSLKAGAVDFIKKPFVPEVLLLRVRHTLDLTRLQTSLTQEVERKTAEVVEQNRRVEQMAQQIVKALAGAIDAKDTYTNGHSSRVAYYAREIARRAGFTELEQENIYMMGLLHDVGKIGISDSIINKPAKLTEDEYSQIMNHPVLGAQILKNITEFPELVIGARWHHERYNGTGYPDGLSGELIPCEARIIGVADAYDAMTSRRSYRGVMPQERVRAEIEEGKGFQFDPVYADIMLTMIQEDTAYRLREDPDGGK